LYLIRPMEVATALLTSSNVAEPSAGESTWSGATTYAADDQAISTSTHRKYQSVQGSNTNHDPTVDDGTWWIDIGPTNRYAMFDNKTGTQTENADSIAASIDLSSTVDSFALLNLDAASVRVKMTDDNDGIVYDQTFDLIDLSGITDPYSWCFDPIAKQTSLVRKDMPKYGTTASVAVTITKTGGTAKCGVCAVGLSKEMGQVQYGAQIGIQDFSIKSTDDFGNYTIVERNFADTAQFDVRLANSQVDQVKKLLASYRATPIVYVGTETFESTVVFGFYRDFRVVIQFLEAAVCTIELEGLA
jgi:hypothetical protein